MARLGYTLLGSLKSCNILNQEHCHFELNQNSNGERVQKNGIEKQIKMFVM